MRYLDAYFDFFRSPRWLANLALGGLCMLIPVVGVMVYVGYLEGVVRWLVFGSPMAGTGSARPAAEPAVPAPTGDAAPGAPAQPAGPPDFFLERFVDYLVRGVWPFVVTFLAQLVLVPVALLAMGLTVLLIVASAAATSGGAGPGGAADVLVFTLVALAVLAIWLALTVGWMVIVTPLALRAMLMQDFAGAFSAAFVREFLRRVWKEALLAALFQAAMGLPLIVLGYATCFVGFYPAAALMAFANWHLHAQLYRLYLERGGAPVPPPARPPGGGHCLHCGYDLRGSPGPTCPECGTVRLSPPTAPPTLPAG